MKLRTYKIFPRVNVLIFFQQFEAQNVLILFLTAIYSFMVENRLQRPFGVYVCPIFISRTCVHARQVILIVLHVLYQVIKFIQCVMLCVMTACHAHFAIFSFYARFAIFSFFNVFFINFHFSLKLFLICSYFSGDLSLTVLIKCVLNKKKKSVLCNDRTSILYGD